MFFSIKAGVNGGACGRLSTLLLLGSSGPSEAFPFPGKGQSVPWWPLCHPWLTSINSAQLSVNRNKGITKHSARGDAKPKVAIILNRIIFSHTHTHTTNTGPRWWKITLNLATAVATTRKPLTFSFKDETPPPSYQLMFSKPSSVISTRSLAPLSNATDVIRAYSGNQGYWRKRCVLLRKPEEPSRTVRPINPDPDFTERTGEVRCRTVIQNWAWLLCLWYKKSFLRNESGLSVLELFIKLQIYALPRENAKSISQVCSQSQMNPSYWPPLGLVCVHLASTHYTVIPRSHEIRHTKYTFIETWGQGYYLH